MAKIQRGIDLSKAMATRDSKSQWRQKAENCRKLVKHS